MAISSALISCLLALVQEQCFKSEQRIFCILVGRNQGSGKGSCSRRDARRRYKEKESSGKICSRLASCDDSPWKGRQRWLQEGTLTQMGEIFVSNFDFEMTFIVVLSLPFCF
mmetsp:Transcript_436/g.776  ORF Transcript_436/g.776 Transcript_436/m.776 type:complete len:112 (+) Transcript_436:944-1279(+)